MSRKRGGYSEEAVERIWDRFHEAVRKRPADEARDEAVERTRREGFEVPPENRSRDVHDDGRPARRKFED